MPDKNNRVRVSDRVVIYPRGKKGIYLAEFWYAGAHRRKSLKTANQKIARERALQIAADLSAGEYRSAPTPVTVEQVIRDFLATLPANRASAETIRRYGIVLDKVRVFLTKIGVNRLSQLTLHHVDRYRAERAAVCQPTSLHLESRLIKQVLRWAHDRDLIRDNPLAKARYPRLPARTQACPTLVEVRRILAAACGPLRLQLLVLTYTGMRSGELRRLRREDVDLEHGWIYIRSRPGAETKTREDRKVPIHPTLREALAGERSSGPWAFTDFRRRGEPADDPINSPALNVGLKHVLKRLDLPIGRPDGYVIHSFRHFFETHMVNAGVPQKVIDLWLGHRSDRSMGRVYFHLSDAESQRRMNSVSFEADPPAGVAGMEG
jgi:integrase